MLPPFTLNYARICSLTTSTIPNKKRGCRACAPTSGSVRPRRVLVCFTQRRITPTTRATAHQHPMSRPRRDSLFLKRDPKAEASKCERRFESGRGCTSVRSDFDERVSISTLRSARGAGARTDVHPRSKDLLADMIDAVLFEPGRIDRASGQSVAFPSHAWRFCTPLSACSGGGRMNASGLYLRFTARQLVSRVCAAR